MGDQGYSSRSASLGQATSNNGDFANEKSDPAVARGRWLRAQQAVDPSYTPRPSDCAAMGIKLSDLQGKAAVIAKYPELRAFLSHGVESHRRNVASLNKDYDWADKVSDVAERAYEGAASLFSSSSGDK